MTKKNKINPEEPQDQEARKDAPEEATPETEGQEAEAQKTEGSTSSVEEQLAQAKEDSRQNYERYLRTVADWENYRRRMTREKEELRHHVMAGLLEDFLPVLDNLGLGLQTAAKHPEAEKVVQGFSMVADQIRGILEKHGVSEINPEGEAFDPHAHESLTHQPHDEIAEGQVSQVIRKGYTLNGRLLRPASVVVSSGPALETDEA